MSRPCLPRGLSLEKDLRDLIEGLSPKPAAVSIRRESFAAITTQDVAVQVTMGSWGSHTHTHARRVVEYA